MAAKQKVRTISVNDLLWGKLRDLSEKEQRAMSELIREALTDLFEKKERKGYDPVKDRYTG